jgi:hypothetical protein
VLAHLQRIPVAILAPVLSPLLNELGELDEVLVAAGPRQGAEWSRSWRLAWAAIKDGGLLLLDDLPALLDCLPRDSSGDPDPIATRIVEHACNSAPFGIIAAISPSALNTAVFVRGSLTEPILRLARAQSAILLGPSDPRIQLGELGNPPLSLPTWMRGLSFPLGRGRLALQNEIVGTVTLPAMVDPTSDGERDGDGESGATLEAVVALPSGVRHLWGSRLFWQVVDGMTRPAVAALAPGSRTPVPSPSAPRFRATADELEPLWRPLSPDARLVAAGLASGFSGSLAELVVMSEAVSGP